MSFYARFGSLRREIKRATLLTPLDPLVAMVANAADALAPRVSGRDAADEEVVLAGSVKLTFPGQTPSANRLRAGGYEPDVSEFVRASLKPGLAFVDAGANVGYYTLLAARAVGSTGRVYAFEPDAEVYRYLETNARLNQFAQVSTANVALADVPGEGTFIPSAYEGGFLTSSPELPRGERVPVESLDHYFEGLGWPAIDLVKLDVEGAELRVLRGMQSVAERNPGLQVILEFNLATLQRARVSPESLRMQLRSLGFTRGRIVELKRLIELVRPLPVSHLVYNLVVWR